MKYLLDQ